jgi:serralysin
MEGVANPSTTDIENTFGLFTADGTPKLAAVAIHNLTSILSDSAAAAQSFSTGSLSYTISGLPGTGSSILLEKASGAFDLMVWNEAPDWNSDTQSEISVSPTSTSIAFGQTYGTAKIFDPMQGANPVQTLSNVANVTLGMTDHPLIVEIEPAVATPTPTPTPTPTASPDNTVVTTAGPAIIDGHGNSWTLTAGGQVAVNGTADATTSSVVELAYEKGVIWQENSNKLWWSKTQPTDAWGPAAGTATSPVPGTPAPTPTPRRECHDDALPGRTPHGCPYPSLQRPRVDRDRAGITRGQH